MPGRLAKCLVRAALATFVVAVPAGSISAQLLPNQAVIVDSATHQLYVVDDAGAILSSTPVSATTGSTGIDAVVTPDGGTALVTLFNPQQINFFDLYTSPPTLTGTMSLPLNAEDISIGCTSSGFALITDGGTIGRVVSVNVTTRTIAHSIVLSGGATAQAVDVTHDGTLALVAGTNSNTVRLLLVDPTTGVLTDTGVNVPRGSSVNPNNVTISPTGRTALVTNSLSNSVDVLAISGSTVSYVTSINLGARQQSTAFTPDGYSAFVYQTTIGVVARLAIDASDNVTDTAVRISGLGTAPSFFGVDHIAATATGALYVRSTNAFRVISTATNTVTAGPTPIGSGGGGVATLTSATGLWSAFTATPTRGASPLTVQFTDRTFTSDLGGVTSWAWDFDGDSSPDSTLQNPSWTFGCGSHSVSLTVTDATHAPSTVTRTNLIVTDIVTPNFSYQAVGGNVVTFTDTTLPPATSWAWDFDNDNVIDSWDQNPTHSFPSTSMTSNVRLTASRLCGPAASITKLVVTPTLALPTLFTGGTAVGAWYGQEGNLFDLTVTNPNGISISGVTMFPFSYYGWVGMPLTVDMYITRAPGGYASNFANPAAWRRVATGTGLYNGGTETSPVPIDMSFTHGAYLSPGTYGIALVLSGAGLVTTPATATNTTYSNADVALSLGGANLYPLDPYYSQWYWYPGRIWNGVLYYDLGGQTDFTPPTANAGPDSLVTNRDVYLDGSASSDETCTVSELEYQWTLTAKPIGSNAVLNNDHQGPTGPWFHVDVWGEYRISLLVIDLQGNVSDADEVVFTLPQDTTPPTANAGQNQSIHVGWIYLDGSASYDDISPTSALLYEWTLASKPAGSNAYLYYSTYSWQYSYEYLITDAVGEYRVSLVVIDEQGNRSEPSEVVLSTTNMAPVAIAGPDQVGLVNNWVIVYGWDSYDPDYDYLNYSWTITSAPAGSNAYFAYGGSYYSYDYLVPDVVGTYEISLIVNDQWGGYSAPDIVSVVVVTPAEWAAIRLGEASTQIGTFDPSAFDAPGHKNSLRNQLAQIATLIHNNNLTQARAHLEEVISRTDGWPLRYAVDPKGLGQPNAADFIVGYYEQYDTWYRLQEALSYLNQ